MKIKHIVIIIAVVLVAGTSCDITNTIPRDSITDLTYWHTPTDMQLYVNSFYQNLPGPAFNVERYYDITSDNNIPPTQAPKLFNNVSVPASGGGWDWGTVRNLNYGLTHYTTVKGATAEVMQYLGELHFFRAWEYFSKVRTFGDVPWISKDLNVTDLDILYAPRDPMKTVMDSIIADLQFAVTNIPSPVTLGAASGRLNKYAAMTMLARVALYEGTYLKYNGQNGDAYLTLAATTAQAIMATGLYAIVKANASLAFPGYPLYYKQQFITPDLTSNKECIMPRIFILNLITNRESGTAFASGYGCSKDFIESFLCTDGKPIALSPLYLGDDSSWMEMTNRDPRLRNMIDNKFLPFYMTNGALTSYPVSPVSVSRCGSGYMLAKYRDPNPPINEANMTDDDFNIFRYAEVLLIYAEAKAELGTITQADLDNSINLLRGRMDDPAAGLVMGRLTLNPPADPLANYNGQPRYGYAISPLLYEIRRERRIELAFEDFRWDDIVRWKAGKLIEDPKTWHGINVTQGVIDRQKFYNGGKDQFSGRTYLSITDWDGKTKKLLQTYNNVNSRTWVDKNYFNPLPSDQLTLNPKLVQNPGY